jgi:hypothetical protein
MLVLRRILGLLIIGSWDLARLDSHLFKVGLHYYYQGKGGPVKT